ncbi:MAG: chromate resistance protein [Burkholderiales bacterium]|nr:chromate resistance protein [Burkholderiales bacterium]
MDSISVPALAARQAAAAEFDLIDVRRAVARRKQGADLPGGRWLDPERVLSWKDELVVGPRRVVYCAHGHEISQGITAMLRAMGHDAVSLEGGFSAWQAAGQPVVALPAATRWVTRERPKIDRIACPWLIRRFVDANAEFLYVPAAEVLTSAEREQATPYDVPGVHFTHDGERCSFDAFIAHYRLDDPALARLATIVRGADTDRPDLAPQSAGLAAIALGMSALFDEDQECLRQGLVVYDALYAWCQKTPREPHRWA